MAWLNTQRRILLLLLAFMLLFSFAATGDMWIGWVRPFKMHIFYSLVRNAHHRLRNVDAGDNDNPARSADHY